MLVRKHDRVERFFLMFGEVVGVRRTKQLTFYSVFLEQNCGSLEVLFFDFERLKSCAGRVASRGAPTIKETALHCGDFRDLSTFL